MDVDELLVDTHPDAIIAEGLQRTCSRDSFPSDEVADLLLDVQTAIWDWYESTIDDAELQ